MARARWLAPWEGKALKPTIYHVVSRVVDRQFRLGDLEKEKFVELMRGTEAFSGCRVLTFCVLSNHFHILLEVPARSSELLSDHDFLRKVAEIFPKNRWEDIRDQLKRARAAKDLVAAEKILSSQTYRMNDLSEFMKLLLQRFSSWFNRVHKRTGRLWEQRFTSVIVESGMAAVAVAAYIDLNPVRAGIVTDPVDYRWCGYSEAMAGLVLAQAGLVRTLRHNTPEEGRTAPDGAQAGTEEDGDAQIAAAWREGGYGKRYRICLMGESSEVGDADGKVRRKGMSAADVAKEQGRLPKDASDMELRIYKVVRNSVKHFTHGAVIGSRDFVDEVFEGSKQFFGPKRKSGARKPKGNLSGLAGEIWSARDLGSEKEK